MTRLLLPDDVVFSCQQSGACCHNDWLIGVEDAARARLEAVDWTRLPPPLPPGPKFRPLPFALAGGERATFARQSDGACVFLEPDARCGIHTRLGAPAKPQVCREFPYSFVETPEGVAVGVSFACTAVRAHLGRTLPAQAARRGSCGGPCWRRNAPKNMSFSCVVNTGKTLTQIAPTP